MRSRLLLALSITMGLHAQQNPASLLLRAQAKVLASLDRLPRFMCTETVDRSRYVPHFVVSGTAASCERSPTQPTTRLATSDRLRLDVAQASNKEMYSWVGENRFDDRDITDIVSDGAISDGSFTGYLSLIFRTDNAAFTYNGETTRNGRALSEFGFEVPREKSHYAFSDGQHRVITAYGGTFLVDPQSADLIQLTVRTSSLSAETTACYASTTLDYTRLSLGGSDFLLPESTLFRIVNADGGTSQNRTVLSSCHEFLGESTLKFDTPTETPVRQATRNTQAPIIPPGLPFKFALTQGIDTASAATGDPVKGKLMTPIRVESKVLVPAGTAVGARIVRFRQAYGDEPSVTLDLVLETINTGGVLLPLTAYPARNPFPKSKPGTLQRDINLGTLQGLQNRSIELVFRNIRQPYLIESGLETEWVTATQPR